MLNEKLQLYEIDIKNLKALRQIELFNSASGVSPQVVAVDYLGRIRMGKLEKIVHMENGKGERDIVINVPGEGYLTDDEVRQVYYIVPITICKN